MCVPEFGPLFGTDLAAAGFILPHSRPAQPSSISNRKEEETKSVAPNDFEETEFIFHQSDDSDNDFPLHSKKEEHYVEKELQQGDTLQSLSLDFNCSIAELKRINKIHKENEIYALRIVKIPIKPGSFIIEKLQAENIKHNVKDDSLTLTAEIHSTHAEADLSRRLTANSIPPSLPPDEEKLKIFDSKQLVSNALSHLNNQSTNCILKGDIQLSDDRRDLNELTEIPVSAQDTSSLWRCNGDDCGLSWKPLLLFILSLGLAGPLLYIIYIAEKRNPT
ncbi:lysM and putative peptidoglycan-binding domain-containing protein 3 isoform X1 [Schistocerca piceifrons]|uniref:lysM and putative peptidoglycan-binding domain-containing protein 3 isoform X1 n=1 Tax=Schistocerca piceifrons TaxID=274613 RepID=UPI001F5E781C|nr:lysM and putative peptidoglycan-binding domain-containing protein 3 isoform X1 [Schistocerca piceifrons]